MPRRKKEDEIPLSERKGPPRCAANARERTRMRVLSKAFGRLKLTLPWVPPDTKLSKLDTLRLATSYISHLQKVLVEDGIDDWDVKQTGIDKSLNPKIDMRCWPYGHQPTSSVPERESKDKLVDHQSECRTRNSHSSPRRCTASSQSDEFSIGLSYDGYYDYCLNQNISIGHPCQQSHECKSTSSDYINLGM